MSDHTEQVENNK